MTKKIIIANYIILGILFLVNIFASFFFFTSGGTSKIFEDNILKVVEIKTTNDEITWGYATGFFIDSNGTILTNRHVVYSNTTSSNYSKIQVRLADTDEWIDAQILKVSENDDLAIIKISKKETKFFKLGSTITNGQTIYTIGNPNGFGLSFTNGVVSSSERNVIYKEQTIKTIQTSFVINEGNSGGPVFDRDGKLLGIISFRLKDNHDNIIQGVAFALPVSIIRAFIQG